MNVSSAVVRTKPEHFEEVLNSLHASDLCDVHFHDEIGKIVITIEGENVDEEMKKMKQIQGLSHVLSAELIYSYSEDELAEAGKLFEKRENIVPEILKDDTEEGRSLMSYFSRIKRKV